MASRDLPYGRTLKKKKSHKSIHSADYKNRMVRNGTKLLVVIYVENRQNIKNNWLITVNRANEMMLDEDG